MAFKILKPRWKPNQGKNYGSDLSDAKIGMQLRICVFLKIGTFIVGLVLSYVYLILLNIL